MGLHNGSADTVKTGLIIGGADCVHEDIKAALTLFTPTAIFAINNIGMSFPHIDYWCSYHAEHFGRWLKRRREIGLPDPKQLWSFRTYKNHPCDMPIQVFRYTFWGGSSALFTVQVAVQELEFDRLVLAGCPLTVTPHFDAKDKKVWAEGYKYREAWEKNAAFVKPRVRSMSGWTKEFLGAPTTEWLT